MGIVFYIEGHEGRRKTTNQNTKMKTQKIAAQNWTGEDITFAHGGNVIEVYDIKFTIEQLPQVDEIPEFKQWKVTDENGISFGITQWGDEEYIGMADGIVCEGYDLKKVAVAIIANIY